MSLVAGVLHPERGKYWLPRCLTCDCHYADHTIGAPGKHATCASHPDCIYRYPKLRCAGCKQRIDHEAMSSDALLWHRTCLEGDREAEEPDPLQPGVAT